jgi:putative peptidoglycan lipid II flippase
VKIASPTFYAMRDARTPLLASLAAVAINLGLNTTLVHVLGYRGLALGTSIASLFDAGLLLWLLQRRIGHTDDSSMVEGFSKVVMASLAMGAAAWLADRELARVLPSGVSIVKHLDVYLTVRLGLSIVAGLAILLAAARLLRVAELDEALERVLRRAAAANGAA